MIELTHRDRLDLRKHLVADVAACSNRLEGHAAASTAAAHILDQLKRDLLALEALGPASDEGPASIEEDPVIQRLAKAAAEELENAWQQQDHIAWIWWAPLAEKLRGHLDAKLPGAADRQLNYGR